MMRRRLLGLYVMCASDLLYAFSILVSLLCIHSGSRVH